MLSVTIEKKVRLSNDPNGLAWAKDENKFGQKLMEKMGWTKGKGLGANEDGMTNNVKVSLKSDKKGVGCTVAHTSKWLDLQDDYEAILATMNASNSSMSNNSPSQDDDKKDFISLVEKSKNTKSRVHYSRIARGKDLSTKAEKDLDCVFGTRGKRGEKTALKKSKEPAAGESIQNAEFGVLTTTSATNVRDYFSQKMSAIKLGKNTKSEKSGESPSSEENPKTELGVITTTSTTSVHDYFAQKMAAMRRVKSDTYLSEMCHENDDVVRAKFSDDTTIGRVVRIEEEIVVEVTGKKSKKKKRKEREDGGSVVKFVVEDSISDKSEALQTEEEPIETFVKNEECCTDVKETCDEENPSSRKSKKKSKKQKADEEQVNSWEKIESSDCVKPIMGKRRKESEITAEDDSTISVRSKKRKRSKEVEEKQDTPCEAETNEHVRVKKRKRDKEVEEDRKTHFETESTDCVRVKKQKRSKKVNDNQEKS